MDWWIDDSLPVGPKWKSNEFPQGFGRGGLVAPGGSSISFSSDVKILDYSRYVPQVSAGRGQIVYYSTGGAVPQ